MARPRSGASRSQSMGAGPRRACAEREVRAPRAESLEEVLANELLQVFMAAIRSYGVDARRVLKSQLAAKSFHDRTPVAKKLMHDVHWLGELATEWAENPHYVDEAGRARVLAIEGKGESFASLADKYFSDRRLKQIVELALRTRVIARVGRDRVAQLNTCVMLTGNPILLLARAVLCVRWLLAATESNGLRAGKKSKLSPDRLAFNFVSKERFEEFANAMRPQLFNVVDTGNRWMGKHTVRDRPRAGSGKAELMGVHAYVFHD